MGIWDDDFTGTNGDPPNASLWEVTANPDDEFVIASNQYALSRSTYSSPAQIWTYITKGLFVFDGDFDFQIDVPSKAVSYNNSGGWCYFGLGIETENGDTWELIGFGSYSTIQNRQYAFGSYASGTPEYRVAYSAASSAWGIKLRFVRSGSTIKGYVWDSDDGNWQWDNSTDGYTFSGIGEGSVRPILRGAIRGVDYSTTVSWNLDNFVVNSGTATRIPVDAPTEDELGLESEIIAYNETVQTPQGLGFQGGIDAQSDYVFSDSNLGINADIDTSENVFQAGTSGGLGIQGETDSYKATDQIAKTIGLRAVIDSAFQTKWINEDEFGLNCGVTCNREYVRGAENDIGINADVDAYNFTEWAAANLQRARKVFILTLTGSEDGTTDIEIPISSFQARKRSDSPTYVSAVIRKYDYAAQIAARQNGQIVIDAVYLVAGVESLRQEIVRAPIDTITIDQGPKSRSITLSGYKTVTYHQRSVTLENAIYKRLSAGKLQYRFADVDLFLNPEDELTVGDDTFTVGNITYYVSENQRQMDVFQVEQ